ncbi:MAG TPA: GNAT family N-acetyltransferase [Euryarchaeota archaeon]|nr:acetyltransferase (GNAT) family protein [archaeon BMS3Bbin15]HDL15080.1 GNAT family N-acetyltransferase [Euryarchaeota archaeon]
MCHSDITELLEFANKEGWVSDAQEYEFLLGNNPEGCFTLEFGGEVAGGITTILYNHSAWIGNFIVREELRNRGFGTELFIKALNFLEMRVRTIYLTASPRATSLYTRSGFSQIMRINRWRYRGENTRKMEDYISTPSDTKEALTMDNLSWKDDRSVLLEYNFNKSRIFLNRLPDGFLVIIRIAGVDIIAPWEVREGNHKTAESLLSDAMYFIENRSVMLDVPENNHYAENLLKEYGFYISGHTWFMVKGKLPGINFDNIFAMASLGSIG